MSFTVEGLAPGDELQLPEGGGNVSISASCTSAAPVNLLQIVFNGSVIAQTESPQGAHSLSLTEQLQLPASGWLAARAISDHKAWHEWPVHFAAHTSPVYVLAGKQEIFDCDLGEYLITTMQGGLEWLDTLATRDTPERHTAIKNVFEEAIAEIRNKQHRHANHAIGPDRAK